MSARPIVATLAASSSLLAATLAVAALARPAQADDGDGLPHPSLYFGIYGGYNLVVGDWDIDANADAGKKPASSPIFGGRIGFQFTHWLGLEVGAAVIPFDVQKGGGSGIALHWIGDLVLSPLDTAWGPHIVAGGGAYQLASGDLGKDADWDVHAGLGVHGRLADWLVLRVEGRYNLTDSFSSGLAGVLDITAGLDFFASSGKPSRVLKDTDHDGLFDDEDACPIESGSETAKGCPDEDKDGVQDADDKCPSKPGPAADRGCPDSDSDGIADDLDKCVDTPGDAAHEGCPPPPPDADADGVPDGDDLCPTDPGEKWTKGCPDQDRDGITDKDDKCPAQPGVPEEKGCLPKAVQRKFSGAVKGINFETGSAKIKKSSFALLDEAVKVFTQYPSLKIEISGHTDDQGPDDMNMKLSEDRATSVREYLVGKGIAADRLVAVGYGETKPAAPNKTAAGRAKNRRIEFKILGSN
ncbi:MAG: OmpA family protein [Myxococcota bacterium]